MLKLVTASEMTVEESSDCEEPETLTQCGGVSSICPKCGQENAHLDSCGYGSEPVLACVKCDYNSLDSHDLEEESRCGCEESSRALSGENVSGNDMEVISDTQGTPNSTTTDIVAVGTQNSQSNDALQGISPANNESGDMQPLSASKSSEDTGTKPSFKCKDCGNNSPAWFHKVTCTADIQIMCLICLTILKPTSAFDFAELLKIIESEKMAKRNLVLKETLKRTHKRVTDLKQLQLGDHIAWDREYLVWHHAIVTDVVPSENQLTVIHNSGGIKDFPNGRIASVRVETFEVDCDIEFLYVFEYAEDECFSPEEVIERSTQRLDEVYDPLTNNCEHFARWCKTGVKCSLQRKDFDDRLKMGASGFAKVIEESLVTAARFFGNSESMQDILGVTATNAWAIIDARLGFLTGSTKVIHGLQIGAVLTGIILAFFAEIVFFCCKLYEAKKDADAKDMPAEVFHRGAFQLFSEGLVGLGGGLGAAFGMSLVPYAGPFLSPVGYVLGNWVGRLIGALIGRLIMRLLYRYKILYR